MDRSTQPEHDLRWFIWKEWASDVPHGENSQDQQQTRGEVNMFCGMGRSIKYGVSKCQQLTLALSLLCVQTYLQSHLKGVLSMHPYYCKSPFSGGASFESDHCLVVANIMGRLFESKCELMNEGFLRGLLFYIKVSATKMGFLSVFTLKIYSGKGSMQSLKQMTR